MRIIHELPRSASHRVGQGLMDALILPFLGVLCLVILLQPVLKLEALIIKHPPVESVAAIATPRQLAVMFVATCFGALVLTAVASVTSESLLLRMGLLKRTPMPDLLQRSACYRSQLNGIIMMTVVACALLTLVGMPLIIKLMEGFRS